MPTLYFQVDQTHSLPSLAVDRDVMTAVDGFSALDYKLVPFTILSVPGFHEAFVPSEGDVVVGNIGAMKSHLKAMKLVVKSYDYPASIPEIISGRKIVTTTLASIVSLLLSYMDNAFIKPVETKHHGLPAGVYTKETINPYYTLDTMRMLVYTSNTLVINSEHRVFVHEGKIEHISCYAGKLNSYPSITSIESMILAFNVEAPVAYTLDVAVIHGGRTVLVEVNDFWAIGAYGLNPITYAKMLKARYQQILATAL